MENLLQNTAKQTKIPWIYNLLVINRLTNPPCRPIFFLGSMFTFFLSMFIFVFPLFCNFASKSIGIFMFIFYNYSLLLGWITLFVLAVILYVPTDRKKYTKTYTRSRRFCGTSFLSFGIGIFLQWYFHPRVSNPFVARALYATYFCLGSVFFSTSHITLINPHYQCKRKCAVDTLSLVLSLSLMWSGAVQHINYLLSSG